MVGLVRAVCRQIWISSSIYRTIYSGEFHIQKFHQHFKTGSDSSWNLSSTSVWGKSLLKYRKYLNLFIVSDVVLSLFLRPLFLGPSESLDFYSFFAFPVETHFDWTNSENCNDSGAANPSILVQIYKRTDDFL